MKIEFLGVGGAMNTSSISTSFLINDKVLIDAPPAIPSVLYKNNKELCNIEKIFITHLHGDHYFGLPFLLLEYYLVGRDMELSIYGDEKLEENVRKLINLAYPDIDYDAVIKKGMVKYYPIINHEIINLTEDVKIEPIKSKHTDVETFGFIVEDKEIRAYYSADSEWFEEMNKCIEKVDYVILDGSLQEVTLPGHMSLNRIEEIARNYKNKKFFVVHRCNYECHGEDNVLMPFDGSSYIL